MIRFTTGAAEGGGVEPPRLFARPASNRLPSPIGLSSQTVEPPGIEPGSSVCRTDAFPLGHGPLLDRPGSRTPISWLQSLNRYRPRPASSLFGRRPQLLPVGPAAQILNGVSGS